MAVVKLLTSVPGGFKQVPATDQPQIDLGAATITETGGTQKSVPDALAAKITGDGQNRLPSSKAAFAVRNVAYNSDGSLGFSGVDPVGVPATFTRGTDTVAPDGFSRQAVTFTSTVAANSNVAIDLYSNNSLQYYTAIPGFTYEASVSIASSFTTNFLQMYAVNASGSIIGGTSGGAVGQNLSSGGEVDSYNRASVIFKMPANTVGFFIRQIGSSTAAVNSGGSMGFSALQVARAADGQTEPSRYVDSPSSRARLGRRAVANAAYTALAQDVYIGLTSITASRTITLPPASSFPPGQPLYIADETGLLSNTLVVTIQRAGSDTIAGQTSIDMMSPYQKLVLHSNGSNLWTY